MKSAASAAAVDDEEGVAGSEAQEELVSGLRVFRASEEDNEGVGGSRRGFESDGSARAWGLICMKRSMERLRALVVEELSQQLQRYSG